jgi:uncharacterized protein (DUF433 family)
MHKETISMEDGDYLERIVVDPRILVGKPVIKGTRIPVSLVLNLLGHGYDFSRIREAYPDLTDDDIKAAVNYSEARIRREKIRCASLVPTEPGVLSAAQEGPGILDLT